MIDWENFTKLKEQIEEETGFVCYEVPSQQQTWFGTSDKLSDFKKLAEPYLNTGTIVYTMDNGTYQMWSKNKKVWY